MNKKDRNNRADQMNPNNPKYWKSRGYGNGGRKVVIVHNNRPPRNDGYACPLCGRRGKLTSYLGFGTTMKCGWCGGKFDSDDARR